jgi:hypothetical protein
MTAPKLGKLLLTDEERKRLSDRDLDPAIRKRTTLIVKRKIQNWLNQLEDMQFALENLNETQLENTIADGEVFSLFKLIETLLNKLNFVPVKGPVENPFVQNFTTHASEESLAVKQVIRRAKEADFERNWRVQEFVRFLKECYHDVKKESPAYMKYRLERQHRAIHDMRIPETEDGKGTEADG